MKKQRLFLTITSLISLVILIIGFYYLIYSNDLSMDYATSQFRIHYPTASSISGPGFENFYQKQFVIYKNLYDFLLPLGGIGLILSGIGFYKANK